MIIYAKKVNYLRPECFKGFLNFSKRSKYSSSTIYGKLRWTRGVALLLSLKKESIIIWNHDILHPFLPSSHSSWSNRYFHAAKTRSEEYTIIFHFFYEKRKKITKGYRNRSPEYPKEWLWSDGWDGTPCHPCPRNRRNGNGTGNSSRAPCTPRCCRHLGKRSPRFSKYGRTVSWIRKVSPVRPRSGSRGNRTLWRIGKHSIRRRSADPCPIIRIVSLRLRNWQIWSKNDRGFF